jgi:hypothetical protein
MALKVGGSPGLVVIPPMPEAAKPAVTTGTAATGAPPPPMSAFSGPAARPTVAMPSAPAFTADAAMATARYARLNELLADFPSSQRSEIQKMVGELEAKGVNVVGIAVPTEKGASSATYNFGAIEKGIELKPGFGRSNEILCYIPPEFRDRGVRSFECYHRQDSATERGGPAGGRDPFPGMTCVNFRSTDDGSWRALLPMWGSHAPTGEGKARGAMFAEAYEPAEPGSGKNPAESDYRTMDMRGWGSTPMFTDIDGGKGPTQKVRSDFIRISCPKNTSADGPFDPVFLHQLDVTFQPPAASQVTEMMFTPGAKFAGWGSAPCFEKYGGGQETDGTFVGSLELRPDGKGGAGAAKLPEGAKMRPDGSLEIDLSKYAGKVLAGVEVMAGDSKPDRITNRDGGKGTSGWSVMDMKLENGAAVDQLVHEANIPPNGIITGAPSVANQVITPGMKLVISAKSLGEPATELDPMKYSVCYVPGLRLGFADPAAK